MTSKTPKQAAKFLNDHHMRFAAGFYLFGDASLPGRCFRARVKAGVLQVNDFASWYDVTLETMFRNHNGIDLFTYTPAAAESDEEFARRTDLGRWSERECK